MPFSFSSAFLLLCHHCATLSPSPLPAPSVPLMPRPQKKPTLYLSIFVPLITIFMYFGYLLPSIHMHCFCCHFSCSCVQCCSIPLCIQLSKVLLIIMLIAFRQLTSLHQSRTEEAHCNLTNFFNIELCCLLFGVNFLRFLI